jgi:hypothetical protein
MRNATLSQDGEFKQIFYTSGCEVGMGRGFSAKTKGASRQRTGKAGRKSFGGLAFVLASLFILFLGGCGANTSFSLATPEGAIVGRGGYWNYSPSVIQTGDEQQFWWCGAGQNPNDSTQISDTILYESINLVTGMRSGPTIVLAETKGSWDAKYTCNPRVIRGRFVNPLADGEIYSYEMFYVGAVTGIGNSIGAAFSNDGIHWIKYPEPVIRPTSFVNYGVGQPVAHNVDGRSSITMFYEDYTPAVHHVEATSTDGIHFTVQGMLTSNGMDPKNANPIWGDMGYDPATDYWYAAFNLPLRPAITTGGIVERGQYGFQLYRIRSSSLLTGTTPWEVLKTIDTNLTGYESNFLPSLLHDKYGNINIGPYPNLELFISTSFPKPAWDASPEAAGQTGSIYQWAIAVSTYQPNQNTVALNRYINATTYAVTSGWIDPVKFFPNATLAHLYTKPQHGATQPFYSCKKDSVGYFVSLDVGCGAQRILGLDGYGYLQKPRGIATVALYSCASTRYGEFVSREAGCEGEGKGNLLGYALP